MRWKNLKRREWTRYGPLDRLDPYLLWADTTRFVDFRPQELRMQRVVRTPPETIPVLVELAATVPLEGSAGVAKSGDDQLDIFKQLKDLVTGLAFTPGSRFVSIDVKPALFKALADYPDLKKALLRIELSMPVTSGRGFRSMAFAGPARLTLPAMGIIDDGCPFAHARFVRRGPNVIETRVLAIWDQDGRLGTDGMIYADELNGLIAQAGPAGGRPVEEDLCYELANYTRLRGRATHGAHILDLLAGPVPPRNRVPNGDRPPTFKEEKKGAAIADIVFVQLPAAAVQDNSGKWLSKHVLEGLRLICSETVNHKRVVVNISYGPQTGPHDGSSMLEQAIDETHAVMDKVGRELSVTLPTGNSFDNGSHARFDLRRRRSQELVWQVPPGSEAAAFVEVWLPEGAHPNDISLKVTPPSGSKHGSGWVRAGQMKVWPDATKPSAAVIFLEQVPQSNRRRMILIALAPTASFDLERPFAPHGRWLLRLRNESRSKIAGIDVYIARNGTDLGASLRGRPSKFVDPCYDRTGYLRREEDDPSPRTSPIRRRGSISGMATGERTKVLSGYRLSDRKFARYASSGPSAQNKNPDWAAVSEEACSLPGLRAAGTRSGTFVRISGTSIAAPQEGRRIADGNSTVVIPDDPDRRPFDKERGGQGLSPLP